MSLTNRVHRAERIAKPRIEQIAKMTADLKALLSAAEAIRERQLAEPDHILSASDADILYRADGVEKLIAEVEERIRREQQSGGRQG